MNTKLYPFSQAKHAHDIEFRYNRVKNTMASFFDGEIKLSDEEFQELSNLEDALTELLEVVISSGNGKVVWLTGQQIGLAKECVLWATEIRFRKEW